MFFLNFFFLELTLCSHMFVQLCFPVLQTEKNVKVLTVVLRRHMSEEEDADLVSSTFSSNDTRIFHSEKKRTVSKNNVSHHILLQRFP